MHPYAHCSVIYNNQDVDTAQVPIVSEQVKKMWYIYTMKYYSATKKKETLPFATTQVDLASVMLSEVSQSEKTSTM